MIKDWQGYSCKDILEVFNSEKGEVKTKQIARKITGRNLGNVLLVENKILPSLSGQQDRGLSWYDLPLVEKIEEGDETGNGVWVLTNYGELLVNRLFCRDSYFDEVGFEKPLYQAPEDLVKEAKKEVSPDKL
ncbi:MAG: hypothetical protein ABEK59_09225 [Halobacteria archaeon]